MDKDEKEKEHKACDCNCEDCEDCHNKKDWKDWWHEHHHHYYHRRHGGGGALYGMGLLGAGYYFLQHAVTFNDYLWGILKAIVWPALAVFKLFTIWKI